jgi:uncharacterized protein YkwD
VRVTKRPLWLGLLVGLVCLAGAPAAAQDMARNTAHDTWASGGTSSARTPSTTMGAAELETRLLARTNARRDRHGCRPARLNEALQLAARQHSSRMASRGELSHRLADEPGIDVRAVLAGYTGWRLLAENLAWGQTTARQVFRDWVASPGHRANLDNCRLRDIGIAVVIADGRPWITQDFGRRSR